MSPDPPRGLTWIVAPAGRALALALAVSSLAVSMYVGYRYVGLVDCLAGQAAADARRTSAISAATDAERAADLALLRRQGDVDQLRAAALTARERTDRVRAANPAPPVHSCS